MKTKKLFNFLRVVAIAALVCTLAVIAVMMIYSATPGEKSAQQSNQVAEDIKDVFDVEEEKVESARVQLSEVKGFIGETYTLTHHKILPRRNDGQRGRLHLCRSDYCRSEQ